MQLRKVCNHPYLFEGAEPGPPFGASSVVASCQRALPQVVEWLDVVADEHMPDDRVAQR